MPNLISGMRLSVFTGEFDSKTGWSTAKKIIQLSCGEGLASVTAFKGYEGFGRSRFLHTARILSLSNDLPTMVLIVDTEEKIQDFLPMLDPLADNAVTTLSRCQFQVRSQKR